MRSRMREPVTSEAEYMHASVGKRTQNAIHKSKMLKVFAYCDKLKKRLRSEVTIWQLQ